MKIFFLKKMLYEILRDLKTYFSSIFLFFHCCIVVFVDLSSLIFFVINNCYCNIARILNYATLNQFVIRSELHFSCFFFISFPRWKKGDVPTLMFGNFPLSSALFNFPPFLRSRALKAGEVYHCPQPNLVAYSAIINNSFIILIV